MTRLLGVVAALAFFAGCGGSTADTNVGAAPTTPAASPPSGIVDGAGTVSAGATINACCVSDSPYPKATSSTGMWTLTQGNSGQTIHARVGDTITVRLPGGPAGGYHWPTSSAGEVATRRSASGGYPGDAPSLATFEIVGTGRADLTANNDFTCFHTQPPCLPPSQQWVVHAVVAA